MRKYVAVFLSLVTLLGLTACKADPTEIKNMEYEIEYQKQVYEGVYTGSLSEMMPNGNGKFTSYADDGSVAFDYDGSWEGGKIAGEGYVICPNYCVVFPDVERYGAFEGSTIDGIPTGKGSFKATNGEGTEYCYTGDFENGAFNGNGELCYFEDPPFSRIGTFTNNEFTPTPLEAFTHLGKEESARYNISSNAATFLTERGGLFTLNSSFGLNDYLDTNFRHEAYTKSPEKFGDKLIKLDNLTVVQIHEFSFYNYDAVTFLIASDSNNNFYYTYYLGSVDAYADDIISMYILPLDYFTYDSVSGTSIWAIACAAAYIEKP